MEKIKNKLIYKEGLYNSKNELVLAKAINMIFDKLNNMIDELNKLNSESELNKNNQKQTLN